MTYTNSCITTTTIKTNHLNLNLVCHMSHIFQYLAAFCDVLSTKPGFQRFDKTLLELTMIDYIEKNN